MIRNLFASTLKNSKNTIFNHRPKFLISQQVKDELSVFQEFQKAQEYQQQQKNQLAIEFYNRVIDILEQVQQANTPSYNELLQEIVDLSKNDDKVQKQQVQALEKLIQSQNNSQIDKVQFNNFLSLFDIYIKTDLNKAENLIQTMQNNSSKLQDQDAQIDVLNFQEATLNLLKQNFQQAIEQYKNINNKDIQWKIQQNIGLAEWLSEFSNFNTLQIKKDSYMSNKTLFKEEYQKIAQHFKNALLHLNESQKDIIQPILEQNSEENKEIASKFVFQNSEINTESQIPLLSLVDFSIDIGQDFEPEQNFWLMQTLKYFEAKQQDQIYKPLSSMAYQSFLTGEILKSDGLFGTVNSMIQNETAIYQVVNKFYYGQMLSIVDRREQEGLRIMEEALEEYSQIPVQNHYLKYLAQIKQI